jgi:hypothetical protein
MFASQQIRPPRQFKPEGMGEPVVGVRILVSPGVFTPYIYPVHNRAGTEMLCRLLESRIELKGVRVTEASRAFEFNRSVYIFTVSKRGPALEAIKEELAKLALLECAQVGWRDPREDVWRVCHSKSGRFEMPSDEEFAATKKLLETLIRAGEKDQFENEHRDP